MAATRPAVIAAALLSAAAFACAARGAEARAEPQGPAAFVTWIYDSYGPRKHAALDYDGRDAARVFDPALVALMRRSHRAHADEALDWLSDHDLFCRCQDFSYLRTSVRLQRLSGDRAWVAATFRDAASQGPPQTLRFELVRRGGAWRIGDVLDPQTGSLRAALLEDARKFPIRTRRKGANEPNAGSARQRDERG